MNMVNFYPFLFRFGVSFNYSIPKEIIQSLVDYFQTKYSIEINLTESNDNYDCIAIKDNEAKDFTPILAYKFFERLDEYNITDFDNSIFFIDLARTYSNKFIDNFLISDIIKIISEKKLTKKDFPNFILLFDELERGSLTYDKLFVGHSLHQLLDYCFVFDKNGRTVNKKIDIEEDKSLHGLISETTTSSLERFQFKLVRKINHFKRFDESGEAWIACQQFFYEGKNCQDEVFQLIKDELCRMEVNPSYIIYDSLYSEWLSNAIEAVSNNISSLGINDSYSNYNFENLIDLRDKKDERNNNGWKDSRNLDIVFISDLIHTGSTFKDSIKKITKKFPKGNIHCMSALITDVAYNKYKAGFEETDRQIAINDYSIRYFKKVEQLYSVRSNSKTKCNMCKHRLLPPVSTSEVVSKNLSSFEMWLMSEESGYKIEDYRPRKNRENENRIVPDSLKLFKKNGTLLAIKFEEHLKLSDIYPSDEIAILFPDETKNDIEGAEHLESIEKTPSGYFAKCLNFYNDNYSYLGVPRKMIRLLEESENWDDVKEQFPKIVKQIEDIDKPIVIIDEVNFTGMTFKTITDILYNIQSKSPICYFPIFNFDAKGTFTKYDDTRYQKIKFLTLYELEFAYGQN